MFDVGEREELRARLIDAARQDPHVDAAALLGSAARGAEDRWSDIDLALRLAPGAEQAHVAHEWTRRLQQEETVVDHLDIYASGALYRVFLLASTLQVDLSFWPHGRFVTGGAPIQLLFGRAADLEPAAAGEDAYSHVQWVWLHALHVRSALARGRSWQAVWMLEGIRNRLISLYCLRHGLATHEGRGVDALPGPVRAELATTLAATTDHADLCRIFRVLVTLLLAETDRQALPVPTGLHQTFDELVLSADRHQRPDRSRRLSGPSSAVPQRKGHQS
jgi:predicted nucleotidyltransferase